MGETEEGHIKTPNKSKKDNVDSLTAKSILGEGGVFSKRISDFSVRQSQVDMADAIEDVLKQKQTLLAESGTGTGKTFAYLVPSLLSAKKTLISTGTKHLQEQLFYRDIPLVVETLEISAKVALLKGRSNYVCLYRQRQAGASSRRLERRTVNELEAISNLLPKSKYGDIAEQVEVPEDSSVWPLVTSTVDNCLGQACQYYEDCYINKARKEAMTSDIVVINHHLFFADKSLKEDGFGALLPDVDTIIFDEAHQIPDIASNFLGESFGSRQVNELTNDVRVAELKERSLVADLIPNADQLDKLLTDYRLGFGLSERRVAWSEMLEELPNFSKKMTVLSDKLANFADLLDQASSAGEGLTRCYERALELAQICAKLFSEAEDDSVVRWVELTKRSFRIHETPLNIGEQLNDYFGNQAQARVFTSATLSIDGDFDHYQQLAGLSNDTVTKTWDSPFDYFEQAVLFVPEGLPAPKEDGFVDALFDSVLPVITASSGHAFVLFTSFRIMQDFENKLQESDQTFTILTQGDSNKSDLLQRFVNEPNPVLLGTMSFWEGVDVPGDALRTVIIDKLPFESPFDPVIKARLNAIQQSGDNPFINYQVPRAVITLRQGAGRLIRSQADKGVLMICDSRLRTTHYGKIFLNSLPRMRKTDKLDKVCGFLNSIAQQND